MIEMLKSNLFWIGCGGAFIPELIRLKKNLDSKIVKSTLVKYILVSILWLFFGGLTAYLSEPKSQIAALYIGTCWPLIISNFGKDEDDIEENQDEKTFIAGYRVYLNKLFN